ncbi:MAG: hemolysin [Oleibacter sp.]|nr:hemolysin [Thalassolituus sp.]
MHSVFREPISGLTHLAGAIFAIVALCILAAQAAVHGGVWHMVSFMIFGATLLAMFASSTVYHLIHASDDVIRWLKRVDHMAIFLLIAGTYTPVCLVPLHGPTGWWLFGVVWALAIIGVVLKVVWISAPRWFSTVIYILMGWLVVFVWPVIDQIPADALRWIAYGGICYTVGAVVYATKWPDPWPKWFGFHEIWHLFVIAGGFCHFWAIAYHLADVPVG